MITLEPGRVGGIPTLACIPAGLHPCPVVFYVPGYGGDKAHGLSLAYRLAGRGLACIAFDPLYHGERYDPRLDRAAEPGLGGIYPSETGLDTGVSFFTAIRQCRDDIRALLAHYTTDPRLDVRRAGVTGMSQGGYASFLAFADIPELLAAVPMMGIPTFGLRWRDLLDECAWSNPAWAAVLAQVADRAAAHTAFIESFDPAERLMGAVPRALLVMSGDFDYDQPKSYVLHWLGPMRAAYAACPDRLRWNIYPVGHAVTPQMEQDAADWFAAHLSA